MTPHISTIDEAEAAREQALVRIRELDAEYPGEPTFESIANQLSFLKAYLREPSARTVTVNDFTFGFLGAKVLPEFDEDLSRLLAELSQFVERTFGGH